MGMARRLRSRAVQVKICKVWWAIAAAKLSVAATDMAAPRALRMQT
jgi:hypothetical protein